MNFTDCFKQINALLEQSTIWWQFAAFHPLENRWIALAPDLYAQLQTFRLGYPDFNSADEEALRHVLDEFIPQLRPLKRLVELPRRNAVSAAPDAHWHYQIAGRKWNQISHFASHVPQQQHLLEWCAGKGHLGRLAASQGAKSLTSLEWRADLCQASAALNERLKMEADYCQSSVVCLDVLSGPLDAHFQRHHFALALHACGDLHTSLLRQTVKRQAQGVCLAPCCYNLIDSPVYHPLSHAGAESSLKLSKLDLSLPLRQLATAGARERREQRRERLWRIAFDCLQRRVRGVDEYMPLPTIPKAILKGPFADFIHWAAERKSLQGDVRFQAESLLDEAEARLPAIAQMEWVQNQFQRALEIWLLLDQVVFLEQHGYQCELFEFCDAHDTPRNVMIRATY